MTLPTSYTDQPLPMMPEVPQTVAPEVILEGEVSLTQTFKLDVVKAVVTHRDWFLRTVPVWPARADDPNYFEEKLTAFVCHLIDFAVDFRSRDKDGLTFVSDDPPEYNWGVDSGEPQKIMVWALETGLWSVEDEFVRLEKLSLRTRRVDVIQSDLL